MARIFRLLTQQELEAIDNINLFKLKTFTKDVYDYFLKIKNEVYATKDVPNYRCGLCVEDMVASLKVVYEKTKAELEKEKPAEVKKKSRGRPRKNS